MCTLRPCGSCSRRARDGDRAVAKSFRRPPTRGGVLSTCSHMALAVYILHVAHAHVNMCMRMHMHMCGALGGYLPSDGVPRDFAVLYIQLYTIRRDIESFLATNKCGLLLSLV